jgi:hypothetical protein
MVGVALHRRDGVTLDSDADAAQGDAEAAEARSFAWHRDEL